MARPKLHPVDDWEDPRLSEKAACLGYPVEFFFAKKVGGYTRAICRGCPIKERCREYAIADPNLFGFWGGMTERERQEERDRRKRKSSGGVRQVGVAAS